MRKSVKSTRKWKSAFCASKTGNVALAQGILGVLGAQNAKIVKMSKINEI